MCVLQEGGKISLAGIREKVLGPMNRPLPEVVGGKLKKTA
jgi:hypothetical protein